MNLKLASNLPNPDSTNAERLEPIVFSRSPLAEGPRFLLLFLLSWASIHFTILYYPDSVQRIDFGSIAGIPIRFALPFFAIIPLMLFAFIIHRLFDSRYVIGDEYVRATSGILSLGKRDTRIEYRDLRGVEVDRSLYGRIVNVGDIYAGSAMRADIEIVIKGVRNPSRYRNIILERRHQYLDSMPLESELDLVAGD